MRIDATSGPTNPYHIARAYGASPMGAVKPVGPLMVPAQVTPIRGVTPEQPQEVREGIRQLVAGSVPGRVDFSADQPRQASPTIAMYRHPADRNAAAVGVSLGRSLDVTG